MKLILQEKNLGLSDLNSFCKKLTPLIKEPYLFLLEGDLGSGKTSFVQAWVQTVIDGATGVRSAENLVSSPTFTLHQEYKIKEKKIHHFDLYRLRSEEELETTGFWDFFNLNESLIIEWPDRMDWQSVLTHKKIYKFNFVSVSDSARSISVFEN